MKLYTWPLIIFLLFFRSEYSIGHQIYLKNGELLEISDFWEEDNDICYEKYGAVIKIPKSNIGKIEYETEKKSLEVAKTDYEHGQIRTTKELKAIKWQCKNSCTDSYDKCAYKCIKNSQDNESSNAISTASCKEQCKKNRRHCNYVCIDQFWKHNLKYLKFEYKTSEKPVDEMYILNGRTKDWLVKWDLNRIRSLEKSISQMKKLGPKYYEERIKNKKRSTNEPAWYYYNSKIRRKELELLEAKKDYDLHKYGKGLSEKELDCQKYGRCW